VRVDSIGSNTICFHKNAACVDSLRPLIIDRIKSAVKAIDRLVEVKNVEFRVLVFPERTIPRLGMSGAAPDAKHIYILLDPGHPRLSKSIREELVSTLAHEYHHTLRNRTVGFGSNLFEAMVSEGLADHFSMEVTGGGPPPWCTALAGADLALWRARAEKEWFNPDYDYLAWFIGRNSNIPRDTGYTIGFCVVEEYLAAHPGARASTLYGVSAAAFLPRRDKQ